MRQVLLSFLSKYFLKDIASLVGEVWMSYIFTIYKALLRT